MPKVSCAAEHRRLSSEAKVARILFRSQDLSAIKEYCQKSWKRILEGSVSTQDFIFAKEVRLGTYRYAVSILAFQRERFTRSVTKDHHLLEPQSRPVEC